MAPAARPPGISRLGRRAGSRYSESDSERTRPGSGSTPTARSRVITYDANSCSSRTPRRLMVLNRNATGIDANPTFSAFADGRGALAATLPDFDASASARRAIGVAAATNAVTVVAAGAAPTPTGPAATRSSSSCAVRTSNGSANTRSNAPSISARTRALTGSATSQTAEQHVEGALEARRGITHQRVDTHDLQHDQPVDRAPEQFGDLVR